MKTEVEFHRSNILEVTREAMDLMTRCGADDFPNETCGFVFGDHHIVPIKNIGQYKRRAYTMDPMEMVKAFTDAENHGMQLRIIYHSHPNMGAFFSSIDRDEAMQDGEPTYPDARYIVMSIRTNGYHKKPQPVLADARAYQWNPAIKDFSEITLKVTEDGGSKENR